jgi:hypothetical protein
MAVLNKKAHSVLIIRPGTGEAAWRSLNRKKKHG